MILFSLILILSLGISSISASSMEDNSLNDLEDNSLILEETSVNEDVSALEGNIQNTNDEDKNTVLEDNDQILPDNNIKADSNSFTDLQNLIDDSGNYMELNSSYTFKNGDNVNGILINKDITIDGKGNTLNGAYAGRIFNVSQSRTLTLKNLNIVNGNSTFCGGAIYSEGNLIVEDTNFTNNRIRGALYDHVYGDDYDDFHGGAIYSTGTNQFLNCIFNNNIGEIGGAIYSTGNCSFEKCVFYRNKAIGGAEYQMSCEFDYVLLGGEGAAVYCFGNSSFKDTEFIENYGDLEDARGSGVIFLGAYSTVDNCTFYKNDADSMIYWLYDGIIKNSNFYYNYGYEFGAIYFGGNGTIDTCNFVNNSRAHYGGAIFALGNIEYLDETGEHFIYLDSDITIKNCNFVNNSAFMSGGAVCLYEGATVLDCTFINNRVNVTDYREFNEYYDYYDFSNESKGGAIYIDSGNVNNCIFVNNSAYLYGGAIFNMNNASLANNNFSNNRADTKGNEIYNYGNLSLSDNNINIYQIPDYVGIYNENFFGNGLILSPTNLVISDNKTYYLSDDCEFNVTASLSDDNENLIEDTRIILKVYSNGLDSQNIDLNALDYDQYIAYFNIESSSFEAHLTDLESELILISADYEGSNNLNILTAMIKRGLIPTKISSSIDASNGSAVSINLNITTVDGEFINETVNLKIVDDENRTIISQDIPVNGSINVIVKNLTVGNYNTTLSFNGSDVYSSCENLNSFVIEKINPPLIIDINFIESSNNLEIALSLGNINGTVTLFITNLDCIYLNLTDGNGKVELSNLKAGNYTVFAVFDGNEYCDYTWNSKEFIVIPTQKEKLATVIDYKNMTTTAVDTASDGRIGEYFTITLKDSAGNPLANKHVQIGFNGVVYDRYTDNKGQAKLQINLKGQGTYTFAVAFLGDDEFNGSFIVAKIVVKTQKGSLTVPNKSYKASASTKTLTATFKSAKGNPVKGKKVSFTVNGKTYTATTNAKGVATVKVSLNKKGTYSFTAKFAGDNTYAAITKTAKLTIK